MTEVSKVMVGIVLYNPDIKRLIKNINTCLNQVNKILLIDNASRNIAEVLSIYEDNSKVTIEQNKQNEGIAYALNQIMQYAIKNSFDFFATLDQDSVVENNYFFTMTSELKKISNWAVACPQVKDINLPFKNTEHGIKEVFNAKQVITSGCLINAQVAEKVGGFNNKLFIDYVDVDFNERILLAGYKIIRINDAILYHELGYSQYRKLLGIKILVDNHSALRRYYITRNRLFYSRKYFGKVGYVKERIKVFLTKIKILLFEKEKRKKIKFINRGIIDERKL